MYLEKDDMIVCDNCKRLDVEAWPHVISLRQIISPSNHYPVIENYTSPGHVKKDGHIDLCKVCREGLANAMLALLVKAE